jgi:hypothetical protein
MGALELSAHVRLLWACRTAVCLCYKNSSRRPLYVINVLEEATLLQSSAQGGSILEVCQLCTMTVVWVGRLGL